MNNEAYNTIVGKYLDYSKFYRPSCYMLHHATITFDFCCFRAIKPITTGFKGLCHFFVLIFAVFGPNLRYTYRKRNGSLKNEIKMAAAAILDFRHTSGFTFY